ncbi:hypothetical protein AAG570_001455 [Ranatra chinensis]|uniref:Uncharacterized protein n=1 Tax=Ranatra chinensis TaxID=642074 RepID=A0ABD0YMM5_9HEMI
MLVPSWVQPMDERCVGGWDYHKGGRLAPLRERHLHKHPFVHTAKANPSPLSPQPALFTQFTPRLSSVQIFEYSDIELSGWSMMSYQDRTRKKFGAAHCYRNVDDTFCIIDKTTDASEKLLKFLGDRHPSIWFTHIHNRQQIFYFNL